MSCAPSAHIPHPPVRKAVFPIAGLGTRFLPATKASPKEMLPVVDKPLIQYAVEEAYASGIRQMIFVTGRTKRPVEDHFDTAYELETELERTGKHELLALARSIAPDDMSCVYVRQPRALGLGHAVLCAQELIGNEPFAVLLADDFMQGSPPVLAQLLGEYQRSGQSVIAVMQVAREQVSSYGIVAGAADHAGVIQIERMVEKPEPELAPSNTAIVGRYVLTPSVLHELRDIAHGRLVRTAGIVITRQRPASASGVTFVTLEDETGHVNLIVWAAVAEAQRRPFLEAQLMEVHGELQREGEVQHVIVRRLIDRTRWLGALRTADHAISLIRPVPLAEQARRTVASRLAARVQQSHNKPRRA
ncbi:MAG: NTP transferase domain-containing protein [Brachymonas sp.]|nr:NTP transferase domain-containing protein [Brachymonas sp.]